MSCEVTLRPSLRLRSRRISSSSNFTRTGNHAAILTMPRRSWREPPALLVGVSGWTSAGVADAASCSCLCNRAAKFFAMVYSFTGKMVQGFNGVPVNRLNFSGGFALRFDFLRSPAVLIGIFEGHPVAERIRTDRKSSGGQILHRLVQPAGLRSGLIDDDERAGSIRCFLNEVIGRLYSFQVFHRGLGRYYDQIGQFYWPDRMV